MVCGMTSGNGFWWPIRTCGFSPMVRDFGWMTGRRCSSGCAAIREVISQAGITAGQDYGEGVNLLGFEPDTGKRSVTSLPQAVTKGDLSFKATKPGVDGGVLLGSRLASRLSVYPGDIVTLVPVTQAKINPALGVAVPRFWKFEVTGLFDTGMFQYDNQFVVMPRALAQRFTGLGDAVS